MNVQTVAALLLSRVLPSYCIVGSIVMPGNKSPSSKRSQLTYLCIHRSFLGNRGHFRGREVIALHVCVHSYEEMRRIHLSFLEDSIGIACNKTDQTT